MISTIVNSLEFHSRETPDHEFVRDLTSPGDPESISYEAAWTRIEAIAAGMREAGVERGDRVALRLTNSWNFVACLMAALRIGAVATPTITQYSADELRFALEDSGSKLLFFDDPESELIEAALPEGAEAVFAGHGDPPGGLPSLESFARTDIEITRIGWAESGDPAVIFYTSGTHSRPKGVVLSHGAILESCLLNAEGWRIRPDDRGLILLPMFHCNALFMQMIPLMLSGATAVIGNRFSASRYIAQTREHGITMANLTAGAIRSVLAQEPTDSDGDHSIRMLTFGLPLKAEEIEEIQRRFGTPCYMCYGLTESSAGGVRAPIHFDPRSGWQSLGLAQSGWDVRIVDESGTDVGYRKQGEILLKGPGVMTEYWGRPDLTEETVVDGWLHTGDLGSIDECGYITFSSRKKDMLKPKGENVAASEIEAVLEDHPAIKESAVVGVFDPHHEEKIVAFYSCSETEPDVDELVLHCEERLASFKVPKQFIRLHELPKTSIQKINKGELLKIAARS